MECAARDNPAAEAGVGGAVVEVPEANEVGEGVEAQASTVAGSGEHWTRAAAWFALLAALVLAPVIASPGSMLYSGIFAVKDWTIRLLISGALAFWAFSIARGGSLRWHRALWIPTGLLAWATVSTLVSGNPGTSLIGTPLGEAGLLALVSCMAGGFLALQLADTAGRVRTMMRAVTLSAALVASYGLVQTLGLDPDPFGWATIPWGSFRSFSTLGNPDMFGAFMVLTLFLAGGLALSESSMRWKSIAAGAFVLIGTAVFTSLTRAAWLGAVIGLVILVVLLVRLKFRISRVEIIAVCLLACFLAVAVVASLGQEGPDSNVGARVQNLGDLTHRNTTARIETWRIAGKAIAERPITGWGPDSFQFAFEENRTRAYSEIADPYVSMMSAHNWAVQTAVEVGVAGLLGVVAFLCAVAVTTLHWFSRTAEGEWTRTHLLLAGGWIACAAFLVTSLLTPGSPPSRLLLWCLLGVLISPASARVEVRQGIPRSLATWAGVLLGAVGVVLAGVALYADARAAVALDTSTAALARVQAARNASSLNPLSAEYAVIESDAYIEMLPRIPEVTSRTSQPAFDSALAAARRAIELEPMNPYRRTVLISRLITGSRFADPAYAGEAVTVAEEALERYPNHLDLGYWYAVALLEVDRGADAVKVLRGVLAVRPGFSAAAVKLSDLYVETGDVEAARQVLEASLEQVNDSTVYERLTALGQ